MFSGNNCSLNTGAPRPVSCAPKDYILYTDKEQRNKLNIRDVNAQDASVFPRNIYKGQNFATQQYLWMRPRDPEMMTVLYSEKQTLGDHFTRFSYDPDNFSPGTYARGFNTTKQCSGEEQPAGVAPAKYYSPGYYQANRSQMMSTIQKSL